MPLNYSKWDALELSDDSDIETHPNVDTKSLIRWKQRDIHEKREQRKQKIAYLNAQIACNKVIQGKVDEIYATLKSSSTSSPLAFVNSLVERITKEPSKDCPPTNDPTKLEQTYDGMILTLLNRVVSDAKEKLDKASTPESERADKIASFLIEGIEFHQTKLAESIVEDKRQLEEELAEQKKHITSEDIHDGWDSKYVPAKETPTSVPTTKVEKKKAVTTEFETLNSSAVAAASSSTASPPDEGDEENSDDEGVPELTPSLEAFSKLPLDAFETSFRFIQAHPDVIIQGAADALLVAGFRAEQQGQPKYARQCVHQSLLLQYCEKLGRDGVRVFFNKMMSGDPRAVPVFKEDVERTYSHMKERVRVTQEEMSSQGREQIQLVPENEGQTISFNVPDGPPPENLVLEDPMPEGVDIEQVREMLQIQWDVFESFPDNLKAALRANTLDQVNEVLGELEVAEAEEIVQKLDMSGILNFSSSEIRDETGKGKGKAD
ncbi:hypothetical protein CYLTODRAFT_486792 [Cylindrobasidium torrendii FP15055 ss-10]|uniref:Hsp90 chaperone protein kinase-targeting subunit n=1 Tax=Cylindrobasidium torrendii FP15055 ss-10 TaxID=1314674 RepID=A0A0D7BP87_9AGAR|nr:hypothetical protein CYLTODRAFT_486792 [Cylindrobasidium torrendii FP15055 ss-10]